MLGSETCSSGAASMCQNNQNLYSHKLIFHSYLIFGKCNTSGDSSIHVCVIQEGILWKSHQKKPHHCIYLGFNLKLQFLALIWNVVAQTRGHGAKTQK